MRTDAPFRTTARLLLAALAAAVATAALTQAALAGVSPPIVPGGLQPESGKPILVGHAVGVQIYACAAGAWSFVAPRADLYDDHGKLIVSHFAGPSWQAKDGSTVVGTLLNKVTVDPTAIPWLLLEATSTTHGRLEHTKHIQRVNTTGGLAPAAATCTPELVGVVQEVPYTADYYFWK